MTLYLNWIIFMSNTWIYFLSDQQKNYWIPNTIERNDCLKTESIRAHSLYSMQSFTIRMTSIARALKSKTFLSQKFLKTRNYLMRIIKLDFKLFKSLIIRWFAFQSLFTRIDKKYILHWNSCDKYFASFHFLLKIFE